MTKERTDAFKRFTAAVALLALGASAGYWWAHRTMPSEDATAVPSSTAKSSTDKDAPSGKRSILYWHDPMVPGQKFDRPGKSPSLDMELVPVYAEEVSEVGDVRVSPSVVQNLGIAPRRTPR
jgi:Cu(I)/Ag(I) efflux system membrane fusion protein